jgi:RNA recognition motif-containing protein
MLTNDNYSSLQAVWRQPLLLPDNGINPPVQVVSNELAVQVARMSTTPAVTYLSENDVPISPQLLSEVEKALELTLHNSVIPNVFPFFTPQAVIDPVTNFAPPNVAPVYSQPPSYHQQPYSMSTSTEADVQTVLGLGLPFFLVGFNVIALQALAANPSLLASFKDVNGVYKQPELINLVQTLTQNLAPHTVSQPAAMTTGYAAYNSVPAYMQQQPTLPSFSQPQPIMQQQQQQQPGPGMRGYRGDQNIGDANLYLSGYGPTTTNDEIRAMFAPYVHVTEIVNKSGFSFVNTNDPEGATRAKEALNGSLLGGLPCRINSAKRKERDPTFGLTGTSSASIPSVGTTTTSLSTVGYGQVDVSQIKDDRGNPATKNLFVAGYGPGTTEQQLKDCFGQYVSVVSIVLKNTFAFVNTVDKEAAVLARSSLLGQSLNGGPLRINFAKESGRLGTSFDLGYHGPTGASTSAYGPGRY